MSRLTKLCHDWYVRPKVRPTLSLTCQACQKSRHDCSKSCHNWTPRKTCFLPRKLWHACIIVSRFWAFIHPQFEGKFKQNRLWFFFHQSFFTVAISYFVSLSILFGQFLFSSYIPNISGYTQIFLKVIHNTKIVLFMGFWKNNLWSFILNFHILDERLKMKTQDIFLLMLCS